MDLDVVHRESDLIGGSILFEEMIFTHMDDDFLLDAIDFM